MGSLVTANNFAALNEHMVEHMVRARIGFSTAEAIATDATCTIIRSDSLADNPFGKLLGVMLRSSSLAGEVVR